MNGLDEDVEQATRQCIHELRNVQRLSSKRLLAILDTNRAACDTAQQKSAHSHEELKKLFSRCRRELRSLWIAGEGANGGFVPNSIGEETGIFTDILSTLGFLPSSSERPTSLPSLTLPASSTAAFAMSAVGVAPASAAAAPPTDVQTDPVAAGGVDIDCALDAIEQGPQMALRNSATLLGNFDKLRRRYDKLQPQWQRLEDNIRRAWNNQEPFEVSALVATLQESLSWQSAARTAQDDADLTCGRLLDALDLHDDGARQATELLQARRLIIRGMGHVAAARVSACLWLGGRDRGRDGTFEEVADVLRRNLRRVESLETQIKKSAAAVMQVEDHPTLTQEAVRELIRLKRKVAFAADKLAMASGMSDVQEKAARNSEDLDGGGLLSVALNRDAEAIAHALRKLMEAMDFVSDALRSCPLSNRGYGKHTSVEEVQALRTWIREDLVGKGEDTESESEG